MQNDPLAKQVDFQLGCERLRAGSELYSPSAPEHGLTPTKGSEEAPPLDCLNLLLGHSHRTDSDHEPANGDHSEAFLRCPVKPVHQWIPFCGCGKQISEQEELAQGRAETSSQAHLPSEPMLPTTRYSVSRQGSLLFFSSFCFLQSHPTKGIWKSALHSSVQLLP